MEVLGHYLLWIRPPAVHLVAVGHLEDLRDHEQEEEHKGLDQEEPQVESILPRFSHGRVDPHHLSNQHRREQHV